MNVLTPLALREAAGAPGQAENRAGGDFAGAGLRGGERSGDRAGPAVARADAPAGEQIGDIVACWELAPGALLLLGWQREALPPSGIARLGRRQSDGGPFRCATWAAEPGTDPAGPAQAFALAVRLDGAPLRYGQTLVLRGDPGTGAGGTGADRTGAGRTGAPPDILARLPERVHDPLAFAAEAVRLAGRNPVPLARFLTDILVQPATAGRADVQSMLGAFLAAVAEPDGCVEILAGVPESCVVLQGWGRPEPASLDCLLFGARLARRRALAARFDRPDIAPPCTGAVLVLPPDAAADLDGTTALFLFAGDRLRRRELVALPRLLDAADTATHLRALLPALRCAPPLAERLRSAARQRFAGHDTLNAGLHPVRAAVDLAARSAAGAYLHGWLLDPAAQVAEVTLRSACGAAARLDTVWTRIARPDVTEAFRGAPGLPPVSDAQAHGFAVGAAALGGSSGPLHLDIAFRDGSVAFLPLQEAAPGPSLQARMLGSVDLHKPSGLSIIERHLAPLFLAAASPAAASSGAASPAAASPACAASVVCGTDPGWATALVVALPQRPCLPRALLSQFLRDPLRADEGLVLVCGESWQDADLARLRAELAFRALPAMLLRVPGRACALTALQAALALTREARLLVLGWATHGRDPGWRDALYAAHDRHGEACFCATQLYEDYSIRFAGIDSVHALAQAPWFTAGHGLAGLPEGLAGGVIRTVLAGSLAACLVPRGVARVLAGAGRRHATVEAAELDAFLRLGLAGIDCLWVPEARVYAPDCEPEPEPGHAPAEAVARLVDGWCLRDAWGRAPGDARGQAHAGNGPGVAAPSADTPAADTPA